MLFFAKRSFHSPRSSLSCLNIFLEFHGLSFLLQTKHVHPLMFPSHHHYWLHLKVCQHILLSQVNNTPHLLPSIWRLHLNLQVLHKIPLLMCLPHHLGWSLGPSITFLNPIIFMDILLRVLLLTLPLVTNLHFKFLTSMRP